MRFSQTKKKIILSRKGQRFVVSVSSGQHPSPHHPSLAVLEGGGWIPEGTVAEEARVNTKLPRGMSQSQDLREPSEEKKHKSQSELVSTVIGE